MMGRPHYLVIGAGGHARVVADALIAGGGEVIAFIDREPGAELLGRPVLSESRDLVEFDRAAIQLAIGVGGTRGGAPGILRAGLIERLSREGWMIADVIHPAAAISPSARLGEGVQVLARAVVQPNALIGDGTIVNTAAVVEHDAIVGSHCHISIGAILSGGVTVGANSHIGAGACIREGVTIGRDVTIGMGAVVLGDCPGGSVFFGNPAREANRT
ncbi:acetyltransferase [Altererythrobacter rubellus]|uniref:Acetyltransferase n=1 Tax=Altererythrobacter rubellus TaxID=2173831 RepID=A0A9Y2F5F5_9SPHN|nr:acetyltransferase [Altererythrobacter rubellus]WIW95935.1 acetyltransferase [Altererythrobacter rubellus]